MSWQTANSTHSCLLPGQMPGYIHRALRLDPEQLERVLEYYHVPCLHRRLARAGTAVRTARIWLPAAAAAQAEQFMASSPCFHTCDARRVWRVYSGTLRLPLATRCGAAMGQNDLLLPGGGLRPCQISDDVTTGGRRVMSSCASGRKMIIASCSSSCSSSSCARVHARTRRRPELRSGRA
jgi:hypothetical protein